MWITRRLPGKTRLLLCHSTFCPRTSFLSAPVVNRAEPSDLLPNPIWINPLLARLSRVYPLLRQAKQLVFRRDSNPIHNARQTDPPRPPAGESPGTLVNPRFPRHPLQPTSSDSR